MPTIQYRLKDSTRVPGTTTIIGRFKESGGLIHWAYQCGVDGIDYRKARDKAADAGTLCHEMIKCWLRKEPFMSLVEKGKAGVTTDVAILKNAKKGFAAFLEWTMQSKLEIIDTEMNLVSEEYRFGGCPDAIGRLGGNNMLAVLDWKTSKRLYPDNLLQVAAYRHLLNCNDPRGTVEDAHILRIGKEYADFNHKYVTGPMLDICWEQFKDLRRAYDRDKIIKDMAG